MASTEADVQSRDGVKIHYWVRGSGDPLALIMGFIAVRLKLPALVG